MTNLGWDNKLRVTAVAEILGRLEWASHVFTRKTPDVPNMELLQLFGRESKSGSGEPSIGRN